jgi:hypothetical protein
MIINTLFFVRKKIMTNFGLNFVIIFRLRNVVRIITI